MTLDEPALIGTHLGQLVGREATELLDLAREDGRAAGHAVREHDLDTLPAVSGHDLENRPHLDDEAGLLAYLARKCVLDSLAGISEAAEESPLSRADAWAREEHPAVLVHPEAGAADE